MNKKNLIFYGGVFLAGLILTNAGAYFLLKMTQPKTMHADAINPDSSGAIAHGLTHPQHVEPATNGEIPHDQPTTSDRQSATSPAMEQNGDSAEVAISDAVGNADLLLQPPGMAGLPAQSPQIGDEQDQAGEADAIHDAEAALDQIGESLAKEESDSASALEEKKLVKLAKLMEAMKPSEAAMIAAQLPTETVITLLMKMKDRTAAKVLAAMPVELSSQVASEMSALAQR